MRFLNILEVLSADCHVGLYLFILSLAPVKSDSFVRVAACGATRSEASALSISEVVIPFGKLKQIQSFHIKIL